MAETYRHVVQIHYPLPAPAKRGKVCTITKKGKIRDCSRGIVVGLSEEIVVLVREQTNYQGPVSEATALQSDIGVAGDDMDVLLHAYAKQFGVEMSGYLWYFHTEEEGFNIGALLFPPPSSQVHQIPITLSMLRQFAETKRWAVEYPSHRLHRYRYDIWVNWFLILLLIAGCFLAGFLST